MSAQSSGHPAKVLITQMGPDADDRDSRVVAALLRDAGMEVLYAPPLQEVAQVVRLAEDEDVDAICLFAFAIDRLPIPELLQALEAAGLGDVPVMAGGIVPDADTRALLDAGVSAVLHAGAAREEIVSRVAELAAAARAAKERELLG